MFVWIELDALLQIQSFKGSEWASDLGLTSHSPHKRSFRRQGQFRAKWGQKVKDQGHNQSKYCQKDEDIRIDGSPSSCMWFVPANRLKTSFASPRLIPSCSFPSRLAALLKTSLVLLYTLLFVLLLTGRFQTFCVLTVQRLNCFCSVLSLSQ